MCSFYIHAAISYERTEFTITVFDHNMVKNSETVYNISKYRNCLLFTLVSRRFVYLYSTATIIIYDAAIPNAQKTLYCESAVIQSIVPFANKFGVLFMNLMEVYSSETLEKLHSIKFEWRRSCITAWGDDTYLLIHTPMRSSFSDVTVCDLNGGSKHFTQIKRTSYYELLQSSFMHGFGNIRRIGNILINIDTLESEEFDFLDDDFHGGLISTYPCEDATDLSRFNFRRVTIVDVDDDPNKIYWAVPCDKPAEMRTIEVDIETA